MKFYWTMPARLKAYYQDEIEKYHRALSIDSNITAWMHLERAHIIAQAWPREHCYVHLLMLRFGIRMKDSGEIIGQIPRLLLGGVKSFVGHIPVGNTGGANVPGLQSMEIPGDLASILKSQSSIDRDETANILKHS